VTTPGGVALVAPALIPVAPQRALASMEDHLGRLLRGRSPEGLGWVRPDPLSLRVPLRAYRVTTPATAYGFAAGTDGRAGEDAFSDAPVGDDYLLALNFAYYPDSPPSAKFVNLATGIYTHGDQRWLPSISGTNEIAVHADYSGRGQLICCSATLEFWLVGHSWESRHAWLPGRSTFALTLNALSHALRPPFYQGRQAT
jgi:hypothetical protein